MREWRRQPFTLKVTLVATAVALVCLGVGVSYGVHLVRIWQVG